MSTQQIIYKAKTYEDITKMFEGRWKEAMGKL